MKIIAHRGASLKFRENSIDALLFAAKIGAYAVECDLRQTKDKQYVIFHDKNLMRMAGVDLNVADITLPEMKQHLQNAGYDLLTLNVLGEKYKPKTPVLLHIKITDADENLAYLLKNTGIDFICGLTGAETVKHFNKIFDKDRILAFMGDKNDAQSYLDNGAGIIRLWEQWISNINIGDIKKLPEKPEVWIMANNNFTGNNGSNESLNYFHDLGADGVLINDVELGIKWLSSVKKT